MNSARNYSVFLFVSVLIGNWFAALSIFAEVDHSNIKAIDPTGAPAVTQSETPRTGAVTRAVEVGFKSQKNVLLDGVGIIRTGSIGKIPVLHVYDGTKRADLFAVKLDALESAEQAAQACSKMKPEGKWRLPTKRDLETFLLISSADKEYEGFINFIPPPDSENRDLEPPVFLLWAQNPGEKNAKLNENHTELVRFDGHSLYPDNLDELRKSNDADILRVKATDLSQAHAERVQREKEGLEGWENWFSNLLKEKKIAPDSKEGKKARIFYEGIHNIAQGKKRLAELEAGGPEVLAETRKMIEKQKIHLEQIQKFLKSGIPVVCVFGLPAPKTIDPSLGPAIDPSKP